MPPLSPLCTVPVVSVDSKIPPRPAAAASDLGAGPQPCDPLVVSLVQGGEAAAATGGGGAGGGGMADESVAGGSADATTTGGGGGGDAAAAAAAAAPHSAERSKGMEGTEVLSPGRESERGAE